MIFWDKKYTYISNYDLLFPHYFRRITKRIKWTLSHRRTRYDVSQKSFHPRTEWWAVNEEALSALLRYQYAYWSGGAMELCLDAMNFSCYQTALCMVQSVCLSVCPSPWHTHFIIFPSSHHHRIFRNGYQLQKWWPCRKKVKVRSRTSRSQKLKPDVAISGT